MDGIRVNEDNIILSNELLTKLMYLINNSGISGKEVYRESIKNNEIDYWDFKILIDKIVASVESSVGIFVDNSDKDINLVMYNDVMNSIEEYLKYNPKRKKENVIGRDLIDNKTSNVENLINSLYDFSIKFRNFDMLVDLSKLTDDCQKNMSYFKSKEEMDEFIFKYQECIKNGDIDKTRQVLNILQEEILQEWNSYVKSIDDMDEMTDDNFCFLGHSTLSRKFDTEFFYNYVSTSLFNQDINATFSAPVGFIMKPINIVGAKSHDMYVYNKSDNDEEFLHYSLVPRIDHPQRVIDECLEQKEENEKNGIYRKIYSEVVIKGFEPVGIFCFTDGALEYDDAYTSAYELQKSFPNFKVKVFDTFKRKSGQELTVAKLRLINYIQCLEYGCHNNDIEASELPRYDYFFTMFNRLKEKGNYNKSDIENIYRRNKELISSVDFYDLFTDKYTDLERKFILGNNYSLNIDLLLKGDIRKFWLSSIRTYLSDYVGKLNQYYDGLDEFVVVLNKFEIDDDIICELEKLDNINFYTMTKVILSKRSTHLKEDNEKSENSLVKMNEKYDRLQEKLKTLTSIEEEHDYYKKIEDNSCYYSMIKSDYLDVLKGSKGLIEDMQKLGSEIKELQTELDILEKEKFDLKNEKYENTLEYQEISSGLSNLMVFQNSLLKHPILNGRMIRRNNQKIEKYNQSKRSGEDSFNNNISTQVIELESKLAALENRIKYLSDKKNEFEKQINMNKHDMVNIENRVKELFDCNMSEVEERIKNARDFCEGYDYSNVWLIEKTKKEIEELLKDVNIKRSDLNKNSQELEEIDEFSVLLDERNYKR